MFHLWLTTFLLGLGCANGRDDAHMGDDVIVGLLISDGEWMKGRGEEGNWRRLVHGDGKGINWMFTQDADFGIFMDATHQINIPTFTSHPKDWIQSF